MVFGKQTVRVGALTVALVGFGAGFGSGMQGQTTTSTPQQNVPDAPRPQALPQLNTIPEHQPRVEGKTRHAIA